MVSAGGIGEKWEGRKGDGLKFTNLFLGWRHVLGMLKRIPQGRSTFSIQYSWLMFMWYCGL